jgi:probable HAF family extracellular repeat protein
MHPPNSVTLARAAALAFLFFVVSTPVCLAKGGRYFVTGATVTDLGTLGGAQSWAYDINYHGNVVGVAQAPSGTTHAFYYSAGSMYDVNHGSTCAHSEARGVNYHNQVVGTCWFREGTPHAFRWASGVMALLNDVPPSGEVAESTAVATSDSGYIVGQRGVSNPYFFGSEATLWVTHESFVALHPSPFDWPSRVADVNTYGVAVGYEKDSERARRWRLQWPNVVAEMIPGTSGSVGDVIEPLGVNVHGRVVGTSNCDGYPFATTNCRAWYWDGMSASSMELGMLSTGTYAIADDVNDGGFIAGYGDRVAPGMPPFIDPSVVDAGFLFHPDFGFYVLPSLPMTIPWLTADCRALALNERRSNGRVQVVGYCTTGNGARAVRWDVTVQAERLPFP